MSWARDSGLVLPVSVLGPLRMGLEPGKVPDQLDTVDGVIVRELIWLLL